MQNSYPAGLIGHAQYTSGSSLGQRAPSQDDTAPSVSERSTLAELLHTLTEMHKVTSDLHSIADRACGISGECETSPKPLPNGMLGEVADSMHELRERLYSLHGRLNRIA